MSCCPKAPKIKVGESGDDDVYVQSSDILPGETTECYLRRAGNTTGLHDDKTEYPANKIENNDIPLNNGDTVNVTFRLTPGSTKTISAWSVVTKGEPLPTEVTFSSSGTLTGTFPKESYGKRFKLEITAKAGSETVDVHSYVFSPSKANGSNEIRFVHPLPGARCTSPFSKARLHPVTKVMSPHYGADFSVKPSPPADVVAAADGEVVFTGFEQKGAGNYIKIKHLNSAGKHLCTTVYMHLAQFYVSDGQKVVAGQKIGKEGNTGTGTGAHPHFECRLPNGDRIDPVPLIRGSVEVARETNQDNTAKEDTIETKSDAAALTPENVDAKQDGCEPFGSTYPKDPTLSDDTPPPLPPGTEPTIGDPFEKAWFFTMKHEVGPHWTSAFPTDSDVSAGLIDTAPRRKKVGYVNTPDFPGGETKFGVAQGPNPGIQVRSLGYEAAKKVGYNNYWKRGPEALSGAKPKTAIVLFDLNYLHGVGNANAIKRDIDISSMTDDQAVEALSKAQQAFMRNIVVQKPSRVKYLNGWLKRSREALEYAKSVA